MREPGQQHASAQAVFLTPVLPSRSGMGLAMRAASQLAGLMRVFEVTTVLIPVIDSGQDDRSFAAEFPGSALRRLDFKGREDPYPRLIASLEDPEERLLHFARWAKPSLAAAVSLPVVDGVAECVQRSGASLVHVFRSYLLGALDRVPESVTRSLDLDEDDASSFLSSAAVLERAGSKAAAGWDRLEARAFDRLIALKLKDFAAVTIANADDIPGFLERHPGLPLQWLRNCVQLPALGLLAPRPGSARRDMLFVGSLRYGPNVEGLQWFLTHVLPRLPGARLRVAGRAPPRQLLAHARPGRVEFLGYVDDLAGVYRQAAVAIAPMRSGGGTRLKILEVGAHGVPVVATPEAAAGLWKSVRFWGITASGAHQFACACGRLLGTPEHARSVGRFGRHAVAERFGSMRVEAEWADVFRKLQKGPQE